MNWLAFDLRAYGAALLGCLVAALLALGSDHLLPSVPWMTGLVAGLACAAAARDKSGPRGLVIGTMAVWTAALVEALHVSAGRGLGRAILEFHATLTPPRALAYLVGFALACALARRSLRRGAGERLAGA